MALLGVIFRHGNGYTYAICPRHPGWGCLRAIEVDLDYRCGWMCRRGHLDIRFWPAVPSWIGLEAVVHSRDKDRSLRLEHRFIKPSLGILDYTSDL